MCDRNFGGVKSTNLKIKINKQTISDSKRVFLYILINFDFNKTVQTGNRNFEMRFFKFSSRNFENVISDIFKSKI